MKTYSGVEEELHAFLTSALDREDRLQAPVTLSPGKSPPVPTG